MSKQNLQEFILKAQKILEDKKVKKHQTLYIGAIDQEIEIESLTEEEIEEWISYGDKKKQDAYLCYMGSPTLRELAAELEKLGQIDDYVDVVKIVNAKDRVEISKKILELSGMFGKTTVREADAIKKQ